MIYLMVDQAEPGALPHYIEIGGQGTAYQGLKFVGLFIIRQQSEEAMQA
jgi:hypothetical protein